MTTARYYADQILMRGRDIRVMESADRYTKRAALLDITMAVAKTMADNSIAVIDQSYGMTMREKFVAVRKLATMWRAVRKNVKAKYDDHPISEIHLHVVLCAYHRDIAKNYATTFQSNLAVEHQQYLYQATRLDAAHRVSRTVEQYF
jgi:hypothetical protein